MDFLNRMKALLGDEYEAFLQYYQGENFRGLRVNTLKADADKLKAALPFSFAATPFCPDGYYIPADVVSPGNHPLHHAGAFYIQEPSATSAVEMLGVERGDRVLDLCAAPGGKSTQIGAKLQHTGLLWSNEIVKSRANILLSNIERMGIRNAVVSSCHPEQLCRALAGRFDRVLVDAPCSGEGMFRKNSEAQREWSEEHVKSCAERQLHILNSAKLALKAGGVMVYSTCTFSQEENEGVITRFLAENPDFALEDAGVSFGRQAMGYARRIFPMDGGEGHFAARLRKAGTLYRDDRAAPAERPDERAMDEYRSLFPTLPFGGRVTVRGSKVIAFPAQYFETEGLPVLRAGVILGEFVKNRFEPHHSAFMAASPADCARCIDLPCDGAAIRAFLHGEEIDAPAGCKGYTAVSVDGVTVGFGKASGGRLKNKYPKGLRIKK